MYIYIYIYTYTQVYLGQAKKPGARGEACSAVLRDRRL